MTKELSPKEYIQANAEAYDNLAIIISQPGGKELIQRFADEFGTIETPSGNVLPKLPPKLEASDDNQA